MKYFILITLIFSSLSLAENNDYYLKNKIERKIHPLAWESYDINETLELLYGKNRVYEKSEDIHIFVPSSTSEDYHRIPIRIGSKKKVKSIAILQEKDSDRALTTLFYLYGKSVEIKLSLKARNYPYCTYGNGIKIIIITELEDNHLFINRFLVEETYNHCRASLRDDVSYSKSRLKDNSLMVKNKVYKNGLGLFYFMITNPMITYREAERLKVPVNFISHIKGSIQGKKLFDLYTSEYISGYQGIRMKFENIKLDKCIDFSYTTINGEVKFKSVKPRKAKK